MSLADLRKRTKTDLNKLKQESMKENQKGGQYETDKRLWELKRDSTGNAFALIRFLPTPTIDNDKDPEKAMPWAKVLSHGFKDPSTGKWYIENSLTTIGLPDPVYDMNRELYNNKKEDQAKRQKRQTSYYANILVLSDTQHPENEGKVFLFRFGKKIFDKISSKLIPSDEEVALGAQSQDPFDIDEGMDFKLKIRTVDEYANYDLSEFSAPKPITKKDGKTPFSDDELEKIITSCHSLLAFYDPSNYKSYDELKKRLDEVTGLTAPTPRGAAQSENIQKPVERPAASTQKATDDLDEAELLKQIETDPPFEPDTITSASADEEMSTEDIEKLLADV